MRFRILKSNQGPNNGVTHMCGQSDLHGTTNLIKEELLSQMRHMVIGYHLLRAFTWSSTMDSKIRKGLDHEDKEPENSIHIRRNECTEHY